LQAGGSEKKQVVTWILCRIGADSGLILTAKIVGFGGVVKFGGNGFHA
jgi:hypothetical protein